MGALSSRLEGLEIAEEEESPDPTPLSQLYRSPRSPVSAGNSDQFPPADDEQTVNTALILLIKAVCLTNPLLSAAWTMERKAFIFKTRDNKQKLYEARTDGHLRFIYMSQEISLAFLEVKANTRENSEPEYQESVQIVAWIRSEPDKRTKDGKYR